MHAIDPISDHILYDDADPSTDAQAADSRLEWHEQEHTAPALQHQAEQLLDAAGSPELAKHAIDVAAHQD